IGEVQVVARKRTNTEMSLLSTLKTNNLIVSGISAQQISKSQDKDAAEVIRRVPGITITDGRFVVVRGLIERYNSVMLNNATAPSFEADKRAFSFDAIPSGLIDNILIYKSPAPELPADFAGAAIDVQTKNAADENSFELSYGLKYSENATFNNNFLQHEGSPTDWLGWDNGYRNIPAGVPSTDLFTKLYNWQDLAAYQSGTAELTRISNLFKNNWTTFRKTPFFDQNASATLLRRFTLGKISVGNVTSFSWNLGSEYLEIVRREYQDYDAERKVLHKDFDFDDARSKQTAKMGLIHNWNFIYGKNQKLEFRNFLNQTGVHATSVRDGVNYYNVETLRLFDLKFESRFVYSGQLAGEQLFANDRTRLNWMAGYAFTNRKQPDNRRLTWVQNLDPADERSGEYALRIQNVPNAYMAGRLWIDMDENITDGKIDLTHHFSLFNAQTPWQLK
ncbi:MAG TPA: TonB-dependent receptor plug domain-containing protein, partial [Prolixibacteraceae bacterium]|nr:TonB-dependent receptor plug domain-containing protein [Prolixibacteraceae bacterium]